MVEPGDCRGGAATATGCGDKCRKRLQREVEGEAAQLARERGSESEKRD